MSKYVVVKTHNFDPETEAVEFNNDREASAYLQWEWEDYYNTEIAENDPNDEFISHLDEDECYHDDNYGKVQWDNGDYTEFQLIPVTHKREGFSYDYENHDALVGGTTQNHNLTNDFLMSIIDELEDWLDSKGIRIPNAERDEQDPDGGANIWGDDFDDVTTMLRDTCANYGIIVEDRWEH